jgi:hypothetical protein
MGQDTGPATVWAPSDKQYRASQATENPAESNRTQRRDLAGSDPTPPETTPCPEQFSAGWPP